VLSPPLCALLKRVSRSFYLSVRVLPSAVQAQVALGYLLARAADTVADTPLLPKEQRAAILAELRAAVAGKDASRLLARLRALLSAAPTAAAHPSAQAEHELLLVVGECLRLLRQLSAADQRLIERVLDQLAHGMTVDLQRFPAAEAAVAPARVVALATLAELDEYTYFAAGCVGEFWTDLMARHIPGMERLAAPELRQRGVDLGKALQLVNVLRDAAADLRAGRCYWPTEMLHAHGLSPVALANLAAPGAPPPAPAEARALRRVTIELATLILRAAESAWPYVQAIEVDAVRLRLACAWPLLLALETLTAVHKAGSPILAPGRPVKVTRGQVYALVARSTYAALRDRRGGGRLDRLFADTLAIAQAPPEPTGG
jgi:farnesyl-diphosphate farnesyltransferase